MVQQGLEVDAHRLSQESVLHHRLVEHSSARGSPEILLDPSPPGDVESVVDGIIDPRLLTGKMYRRTARVFRTYHSFYTNSLRALAPVLPDQPLIEAVHRVPLNSAPLTVGPRFAGQMFHAARWHVVDRNVTLLP